MEYSVSGKCAVIEGRNKDNCDSINCDPCYQDGDRKTAEGFCVECQHYLCDKCYEVHCLPRPMKHHKLLRKSEMPKKKVVSSLSEICSKHEGEGIKYYCKTHEKVGCNSCMITDHKPCQISVLTDIAKDVEQSKSYKEFCMRMETLKTNLEDQIQTAKENISISKSCKETAISDIIDLQEKINKQFESLKQQISKEAEEKETKDIRKIKEVEDSANNAKEDLDNLIEDFKILEETKQSKQLFIAFNKSQEKLKTLEQEVDIIQEENKVEKYSFVPNEFLTSMLKNIDALGELCVHGEDETEEDLISFYGHYPEYGLPRGTPISDDMHIVLDTIYNRVRLYREDNDAFVTEKVLSSCPWDVAAIDDSEFAITMPNEKKIKLMSIDYENITEIEEICLQARCEGIHYEEEQLYVACSKPAKVLVLDLTGTILQNISIDQAGKHLFKQPAYITFYDEMQLICVSDRTGSSIVSMTTEGKVKNVFRNKNFRMPLTVFIESDMLKISDFESLLSFDIDLTSCKCEINHGDDVVDDDDDDHDDDDDDDDQDDDNDIRKMFLFAKRFNGRIFGTTFGIED